jgi:hypothetical protein
MKPHIALVRYVRRELSIVFLVLAIVLMTHGVVLADPPLPLPRIPICGDQDGSELPYIVQCAQFAHFPDAQTYQVPGSGVTTFRADFVYRLASYNNELAFFAVDTQSGAIGSLHPGDQGYLAAAFGRATIVFPSGSNASSPDFVSDLAGGKILVFFIVQDSTLARLLSNNPTNDPSKSPLAFFSLDVLNPDHTDHFIGYKNMNANVTQFGFEDLTGGGDMDYDDVVYNVPSSMQPLPLSGPLALPFDLSDKDSGLGYVWSFFDHAYPIYQLEPTGFTQGLLKYTGEQLNYSGTCTAGSNCYSGHNGIDFSRGGVTSGTAVVAAADGTIVPANPDPCLGNIVRVRHGEYLTLYAHMQDDAFLRKSGEVHRGDRIGTVGNSGSRSCTTGPHLHFVVYHDENGDGVFADPDELVDPYGWRDQCSDLRTDPWTIEFRDAYNTRHTGATSEWLWDFDQPACAKIAAGAAYSLVTSEGVLVSVPAGATASAVTLSYSVAPEPGTGADVAASASVDGRDSVSTISTGHTFIFSAIYANGSQLTVFGQPISITVPYSDADLAYGDENSLAVNWWDGAASRWVPLATTLEIEDNQASALSDKPGVFSLRSRPLFPAPQVSSVSPPSGANIGPIKIIIHGANFIETPTVNLGMGGIEAQFVSSSELRAIVSDQWPAGDFDLIVRNPDGQEAILRSAFSMLGSLYLPFVTR